MKHTFYFIRDGKVKYITGPFCEEWMLRPLKMIGHFRVWAALGYKTIIEVVE